jgi:hypothetical protein
MAQAEIGPPADKALVKITPLLRPNPKSVLAHHGEDVHGPPCAPATSRSSEASSTSRMWPRRASPSSVIKMSTGNVFHSDEHCRRISILVFREGGFVKLR